VQIREFFGITRILIFLIINYYIFVQFNWNFRLRNFIFYFTFLKIFIARQKTFFFQGRRLAHITQARVARRAPRRTRADAKKSQNNRP
jgi:hypothetical protein